MSSIPSPLKSPTLTSIQVAAVLQVADRVLLKEDPLERAVHHWPPWSHRPVRSDLPSPLKSPTFTSTQVAAVLQVAQRLVEAAVLPLPRVVHHCPLCSQRPVMSDLPS